MFLLDFAQLFEATRKEKLLPQTLAFLAAAMMSWVSKLAQISGFCL
jgi:hypothetical protein